MSNKSKISREELLKMKAKARRESDVEAGKGINRHHTITNDKKKEKSKKACRNKDLDD